MCVSCFSLFFLVVLVCGGGFLCEVFVVCVCIAVSCPSSCLLFLLWSLCGFVLDVPVCFVVSVCLIVVFSI